MATTQLSDIIKPEPLFLASMLEESTELSRLFQSGMVQMDESFNELARGKGSIFDMPFWNDLDGASEELSDSSSLTPKALGQSKDRAVKHFRGSAWEINDLVPLMVGDNAAQRIRDRLANWWNRDMQKTILIPSLTGIFASALSGTHVNDVAIEDGDNAATDNLIGSDQVIDTANLLGDHWDRIVAIAMHSKPFARLQKLNLIEFEPLSEQGIRIPRFLGREVIVDDGLPTESGNTSGTKYTTYLFGENSVGMGDGTDAIIDNTETPAFEEDRDALANNSFFITRRQFIMHPRGVQFSGTPAGATPTKTELETGGNWTKAWSDKNITLLALISNG